MKLNSAKFIGQTLATNAVSAIRCVHCLCETVRPGGTYLQDMSYPAVVREILITTYNANSS